MTTDEQLVSALKKIRKLIDGGYLNEYVGWTYDTDSTREEENRTLLRLAGDKVLDTVWTDESGDFFPDKNGVLVTGEDNFGAFDMTTGNLHKHAIIGGFNSAAYEHLCLRLGVDPYKDTHIARLRFEGFGTPVVSIGSEQYWFNPLHSGKKKELFMKVVSKHPEKVLTLNQLKTAASLKDALEEDTSINTVLENSIFIKQEPLSPFFTITKDTIVYHSEKALSVSEINAIKSRAKS
jgi:hypothetical protein|tara:strand:+ start:2490 stop:3197 length:708 start_codon:yes stop_codon:yes gene_type:complete